MHRFPSLRPSLVAVSWLLAAIAAGCGLTTLGTQVSDERTCTEDGHCDDGNPCTDDVCGDSGICASRSVVDGALSAQVPGDCKTRVCQAGTLVAVPNDTDIAFDAEECTVEGCQDGEPTQSTRANGSGCAVNAAVGRCVAGTCTVDCEAGGSCDDGEPCTVEWCDASNGTCVFEPLHGVLPPGAKETPGDCRAVVCLEGAASWVPDDTDLPLTSTDCDYEICDKGAPSNPPVALGTACATAQGKVCDEGGACVACNAPADCTEIAVSECQQRACNANVCEPVFTAANTPITPQTGGDCLLAVCDGAGGVTQIPANDPTDDGNFCTINGCQNGQPTVTPKAAGIVCGPNLACNGMGACHCASGAACPPGTLCQDPICDGASCALQNKPAGTPLPAANQIPGDCKRLECTGGSDWTAAPFPSDLPNDNNQCTTDTCNGGTPVHTSVAAGIPCNQNGGKVCNGLANPLQSACVACVNNNHCDAPAVCLANFTCCTPVTCDMQTCGPKVTCGLTLDCNNQAQDGMETDEDCGGGVSTCPTRCAVGKKCLVGTDCMAGNPCRNAICCATACAGPCWRCDLPGTVGTCTAVPLGQDSPGQCAGANTCNGLGDCLKKNGQTCAVGEDCASGFCDQLVCVASLPG